MEMKEQNKGPNSETIFEAYRDLYNENPDREIKQYIIHVLSCEQIEDLYYETKEQEKINKEALIIAETKYPGAVNEKNVDSFIQHFTNTIENQLCERKEGDIGITDVKTLSEPKICPEEETEDIVPEQDDDIEI